MEVVRAFAVVAAQWWTRAHVDNVLTPVLCFAAAGVGDAIRRANRLVGAGAIFGIAIANGTPPVVAPESAGTAEVAVQYTTTGIAETWVGDLLT